MLATLVAEALSTAFFSFSRSNRGVARCIDFHRVWVLPYRGLVSGRATNWKESEVIIVCGDEVGVVIQILRDGNANHSSTEFIGERVPELGYQANFVQTSVSSESSEFGKVRREAPFPLS